MFKNKSKIDTEEIRYAISDLFNKPVEYIKISFESDGFTGKVHKIAVFYKNMTCEKFIIKQLIDNADQNFYDKVLKRYKLNSPNIFGTIFIGKLPHLVIEYIPKNTSVPTNLWYKKALQWLIRKDQISLEHAANIKNTGTVLSKMNDGSSWWLLIEKCVKSGKHPSIDKRLINKLPSIKGTFKMCLDSLENDPQVLNHNDFQYRNTLIHRDTGKFYVIDWTSPRIGSPFIDLSRFIKDNPVYARKITEEYKHAIPIKNFDEQLKKADFRHVLSICVWMCRAIIDGQRKAVENLYDVDLYIGEVINHEVLV